ncbi:MAG: DDE-type integrase/transposase/recombinase [Chloroflexota bacterium]
MWQDAYGPETGRAPPSPAPAGQERSSSRRGVGLPLPRGRRDRAGDRRPPAGALREHRDLASARACFEQAVRRRGVRPRTIVTDKPPAYGRAVRRHARRAVHVRTGLHRARGETTIPIERSHVPTRDRLRSSRGLPTLATGQRCFEGFEALHALRRGHIHLEPLVPGDAASGATRHQRARAVVRALQTLGARLRRAA